MPVELYEFACTIPSGTLVAAPVIRAMAMPPRIVRQIDVRVPPGPQGRVGFSIGAAGMPVIPVNRGAFIITDDEVINWPIVNGLQSGAWQFFGYNLGLLDHTIYVRFQVDLVTSAGDSSGTPPLIGDATLTPLSAEDLAALTGTDPGTVVLDDGTGSLSQADPGAGSAFGGLPPPLPSPMPAGSSSGGAA